MKKQVETVGSTVVENDIKESDFNGGRIIHHGFDYNDIKQKYVNYAYKLGGWDFVYMIECENGNWNIHAVGDGGKSYGLCQMHSGYHKDIPSEYYTTWQTQIEYCYQKWKSGTPFYGPGRVSSKTKWMKCSEYVKPRFSYIE